MQKLRPKIFNVVAGAVLILMTLFVPAHQTYARDLTVVGWGGALSNAIKVSMEVPFQEEFGVKVVSEVYNGGMAEVKAQIEAGNVTWDVIDSNLVSAELGCAEGLLEKIPIKDLPASPDGVSAENDFYESALHECGVANYIWSNIYAYNKNTFDKNAPKTIADFFDIKKFPGKRGMRKSPQVNLPWALMADGIPMNRVYEVLETPEGVDRAFKKLDTIKKHVIWWEAGAQPPQLLADGEVSMTSAYNGRFYNAIVKEGQPFEIVWDGQIWDYGAFVIPKGTSNKTKALEFVRYATSAERLADLVNHISYGPARITGNKLVPENLRKHLPSTPDHMEIGIRANAEFWAD